MTHEEFKSKLQNLNLNLLQFSELINTPYSTSTKWGKSNPVPSWVEPFLNIYEQNLMMENIKKEIKTLAEKL